MYVSLTIQSNPSQQNIVTLVLRLSFAFVPK